MHTVFVIRWTCCQEQNLVTYVNQCSVSRCSSIIIKLHCTSWEKLTDGAHIHPFLNIPWSLHTARCSTPSTFQPQRADAFRHSNGTRGAPRKLYVCLEAPLPRWLDLSAVTCCRNLPPARRRTPSVLQVCDCLQTWDHGNSNICSCYHYWGGRHLAQHVSCCLVI